MAATDILFPLSSILKMKNSKDGLYVIAGVALLVDSIVMEVGENCLILGDVDSRHLLRVNDEDLRGIERNQVLGLNDEGERWEGDVLNNQPYGWGVLYGKEGDMMYEGFRIGDVSVCYGTQYYAGIGVMEYEGMIFEGKRWGKGIQYDRNRVVVYDGEWMNDDHAFEKRMVITDETQFFHNRIEELIVNDKNCNGEEWSVLDLSFMPTLTVLQVGDECFANVNEVKLIGLHELQRVVIGNISFMKLPYKPSKDGMHPNRRFYLKDCERLKELRMGFFSFADYSVCEIENVPSLEVIEMGAFFGGSYNFYNSSLELKSMPGRVRMMTRPTKINICSAW